METMKLMIAVVNRRDGGRLTEALVEAGFRFTEIGSTGGFLREGNVTLLLGLPAGDVDKALALVREHCHSREEAVPVAAADTRLYPNPVGDAVTVQIGGAQVFILNVEQVIRV